MQKFLCAGMIMVLSLMQNLNPSAICINMRAGNYEKTLTRCSTVIIVYEAPPPPPPPTRTIKFFIS